MKPPTAVVPPPTFAVFTTVTVTVRPSATVNCAGSPSGSPSTRTTGVPHSTPATDGRFVSRTVTTVPSGRVGPFSRAPLIGTVSVSPPVTPSGCS